VKFFVALGVSSLGLGMYAMAALLFDRREVVVGWLGRRRAGTVTTAAGRGPVYLGIGAALLLGTSMLAGGCIGVVPG
jgi:hypothetical protein